MLFKLLPTFLLICHGALAMDNLKVAFQWKILDFEYPSEDLRQTALNTKEFVPEHNLPVGLEVVGDRVFVTVPRWKEGVAASLGYFNRSTAPQDSPKLHPYPNWDAHRSIGGNPPEIVSPFRMRADACNRLWVLDSGVDQSIIKKKTQILIYDLKTDELIRSFSLPDEQVKNTSLFANIAVEDTNCEDTYAYLADLGAYSLIVYSFKENRSWLVKHHYFNMDPLAGDLNVSGISFQWEDGLFGLALSSADQDGFSTLYFHPLASFHEFAVSTRVLRDEKLATASDDNFHKFTHLGSRGPKAQSGSSFLDKKTGVLFYALVNLNAVACWRTTNPAYTMTSQGRIYMSNETMVWPNDIKVDNDDNLWVLSDNLPKFFYSSLDYSQVNFRIMTAKVDDAIRGTACAHMLVKNPDIMEKLTPVLNEANLLVSSMTPDKSAGKVYDLAPLSLSLMLLFVVFNHFV